MSKKSSGTSLWENLVPNMSRNQKIFSSKTLVSLTWIDSSHTGKLCFLFWLVAPGELNQAMDDPGDQNTFDKAIQLLLNGVLQNGFHHFANSVCSVLPLLHCEQGSNKILQVSTMYLISLIVPHRLHNLLNLHSLYNNFQSFLVWKSLSNICLTPPSHPWLPS